MLKLAHGGVIAARPLVESDLVARSQINVEAKEAIAIACLREIHNGYSIFLDSGTSTQRIASKLSGCYITVLTNSIGVAGAVADMPAIEHILLGGRLRRVGGCLV